MKNERKNELVQQIIIELKTKSIVDGKPLFKRLATELESPRKNKRAVNLDNIAKHVRDGEVAVVPGKVIGDAKVKCEIYAYQWSQKAGTNNKIYSLRDLIKKNPKRCRIIG